MYNDGYHLPHDFSTLRNLAAVDATVPGGPTMQQLISQCVQAIKHHSHDLAGFHFAQRATGRCSTLLKCLLPFFFCDLTIVIVPEWLKDIFVVDHQADCARELTPYQ